MIKKGFTLIELLVVISIIGILAALGTARYLPAEKSVRDTQRKSDLGQYRVALENYANANGSVYPVPTCGSVSNLCSLGTTSFQSVYLSDKCLSDPLGDASIYYHFCSNGTQYALWAKMESGENDYYVVCSNGKSGKLTPVSEPNISSGNCPL